MKKCPKCKAEIEEEARFCLYCMTPFEEKQIIENPKVNNKRWQIYLAAALVLVILLGIAFIVFKNDTETNSEIPKISSKNEGYNSSYISDGLISAESGLVSENKNNSSANNGSITTAVSSETTASTSKNSVTSFIPDAPATTTSKSSTSTIISTSSSTPSIPSPNNNNSSKNNSNNNAEVTTTSQITAAISYSYRNAKYGDDFSVSANLENSIVITGVKTASSNGEYIIPSTINDKKVIAIMANAFCDSTVAPTVKKVIVPSSVKTIWNYAFASCYNLTDIYFCGNSIYTEANAFAEKSKRNGILTIHCSANCNDRNFRYYKNNASNYDAEYMEWNG